MIELLHEWLIAPFDYGFMRRAAVAGLALGYQAGADSPAGAIRESKSAERVRKPLEDFVFTGSWNQASPIIAK